MLYLDHKLGLKPEFYFYRNIFVHFKNVTFDMFCLLVSDFNLQNKFKCSITELKLEFKMLKMLGLLVK